MTTAAPVLPREIRVRIAGEPCAQGRPRTAVIKGRARVFDPKKSRSWKAEARQAMVLQGVHTLLFPDGPVEVHVTAVFTCPKGDERKREPRPRRRHAKKPDGENVAKAVLDAATGVLWRDDSQVSDLFVAKRVGAQGEAPYVEIAVRAVPENFGAIEFSWPRVDVDHPAKATP